jgi:hypothetical protein
MIDGRLLLLAPLLLPLAACDARDPDETLRNKPYWLKKLELPARPSSFCADSSAILLKTLAASSIVCVDDLPGAFGIKGQVGGAEVVIIQGAAGEWQAFAHVNKNSVTRKPDQRELDVAVDAVVRAFQN